MKFKLLTTLLKKKILLTRRLVHAKLKPELGEGRKADGCGAGSGLSDNL